MIEKPSKPSHAGPFIRDLTVPEQDWPLRPSEIRQPAFTRALRVRLVGAALLAWTAGLVLGTYSLVRQAGAQSSAQTTSPAEDR